MTVLASYDPNRFEKILADARLSESWDKIVEKFPWQRIKVYWHLFRYAQEKNLPVSIFTGAGSELDFDWENYGAYVRGNASAELETRILVYTSNWDEVPKDLQELARDNDYVHLRIAGISTRKDELAHYLLVGETALRKEVPHKYITTSFTEDAPTIGAITWFKAPPDIIKDCEVFNNIWQISEGNDISRMDYSG